MRQIVLLVAVLLLTSCIAVEREQTRVEPTEYEVKYTTDYVNNLNWYMLYMFAYTKSVNEYAIQHGWTPPKTVPICRMIEWPKLLPLPQFRPSYSRDNPRSFEIELGDYVKTIKRAYHNSINGLEEAEKVQRQLCIY